MAIKFKATTKEEIPAQLHSSDRKLPFARPLVLSAARARENWFSSKRRASGLTIDTFDRQ